VWPECIAIKVVSFTDGKVLAKCSHCKIVAFIAASDYGTSNMKKLLENCKAYQATKASQEGGQRKFE